MPCSDGRSDGVQYVYRYKNGVDPAPYEVEIAMLKRKNIQLEAIACALINELESEGLDKRIIPNAVKNGKVDIYSFWEAHKQDDESRLSKDIERYSEHELSVIKKILNKR